MSNIEYHLLMTVFLLFGGASTCENPEIKYSTHTTQDVTVLTHVAYICEFTLKCDSGTPSNLYALLDEGIYPIGKTGPNNQMYQVSWTEPAKTACTGDISIKIFDDDGYALLRKAQRAGDDSNSVPSLGSINIYHGDAYKGPWVSCECLAVAFSLILCYYAIQIRSQLLS